METQDANTMSPDTARQENAYTLGVQAYLWGLPILLNEEVVIEGQKVDAVRINDLKKYTALKTAKDRFIVTPNNVTIDAYGNYDVTKEPVVVIVPVLTEPRWYIVQLGDAFDQIMCNLGGTHGPQPGIYLITGPDFQGDIPGGMIQIKAHTLKGAVGVRIFVNGPTDLGSALEAQKGFRLIPLSIYLRDGLTYKAPDPIAPIELKSDAPTELQFFDLLGQSMQRRLSVSIENEPMIASFRTIGLSVSQGFEWHKLDEPTKAGLVKAAMVGNQIVDARWQSTGEVTNGRRYTMAAGRAGSDFALRATLAKNQLGAQLAEEVLYPNTAIDAEGASLSGANKYVLHFEKGGMPPAATFWNLAMYDQDNLFVENDFERYSIGSTTEGLKSNEDGSMTIVIQNERPLDTANWLPAPAGSFNLTMRFYGPLTAVLDGTYRLPAVQRTQ